MTEIEIFDGVITGGTTDFIFVAETLRRQQAGWCVIDGFAVNTYASPVYSAELELVVMSAQLGQVLDELRAADFRIKEFAFCVKAQRQASLTKSAACMLMVQFTTLEHYQPFVYRAVLRPIFGIDAPVATLPDIVQGELWTWSDPTRRESKRAKDKFDLMRLAEAYPVEVETLLPTELRAEAVANREQNATRGDDGWGGDQWS